MTLIIDTDSYISQEDATTYIDSHYSSTDGKRITWNALLSDDKDIFLRKATQTIESIPIVGIKVDTSQILAFPRAIYTENYYDDVLPNNITYGKHWYIQPEVPDSVKFAQTEIAINNADGISDRIKLQREGVKSFSLGKLSESYGSGKANSLPYEAKELLTPYTLGGGRIG